MTQRPTLSEVKRVAHLLASVFELPAHQTEVRDDVGISAGGIKTTTTCQSLEEQAMIDTIENPKGAVRCSECEHIEISTIMILH
jgi:hypothetical protein